MKGCLISLSCIVVFAYAAIFAITVYVMATGGFDGWKLTLAILTGLDALAGFAQLANREWSDEL